MLMSAAKNHRFTHSLVTAQDVTPSQMLIRLMATAFAAILVMVMATSQAFARPDSFADLAERLSPAVVNISTTTVVSRGGGS